MSRQPPISPDDALSLSGLNLDEDATRPGLPPEIMGEILALLPQATLSTCLRVNTKVYALALPLLYRRIAIPPIAAGTQPHDVRDAHAPKPHGALRGPAPRVLSTTIARLPARVRTDPLDPRSLVHELVVPAHDPDPGVSCSPLSLTLRRLHLVLGANSSELHREQTNASVSALLQRGQARCAGICPLLSRLHVDTLVIHRVRLLYSRLRHILPPQLQPRHVVLLVPPDRANAGSAVKFEYSWAGARGILGFLEHFEDTVDVDVVFDVAGENERWRPIPKPKDGDGDDGVPLWVTRFVRGLARDVGQRHVRVVNLPSTLDDPAGCMGVISDMARTIAAETGCKTVEFVGLKAWRAEGLVGAPW